MARPTDRKRPTKDDKRRPLKKKPCIFCMAKATSVDYKDVNILRRYISDRGKIRARRVSGNCVQHQREVAIAIKTAREVALLPYTTRTVSERRPSRNRGEARPVEDEVVDLDIDIDGDDDDIDEGDD